ncbi:hypothetical protein [Stutzerimonas nitrititolerans]|uniref:hypothetical protein n=1 Tax=Stutzerimonas nitrititolerans TaxID=2482751 RepID=UPI0028AB5A57|nr:hypothetical protein [Stutzerimonas nitrititolerans]
MQCPNCGYEPTLSELQRSPDNCVKCGINYTEFKASIERQAQKERARADELAAMSPEVREVAQEYRGAHPVVVIDINMSFVSMVRFMVKWAIAAIPAVIILMILFWGLTSFISFL